MRDVYNLGKPGKVRVLIFNHTQYKNRKIKARPAQIGVKLEKFFLSLGAHFFYVSHFHDLAKHKVEQKLRKASEDGRKYSAVIVCVSSHGSLIENGNKIFYEIIHAQDGFYYKTDLWRHFKDKEDWRGKPKLFFIQACRGEDPTAGVGKRAKFFTELKYPDLFIMNASQQGTVSWRSKKGVSLFVDALIKVFKEKSSKYDLLSMAVEISNRVAKDQEICSHFLPPSRGQKNKYECCQQMPCFETTLTKKFYFPNASPYLPDRNDFYQNIENPLAIVLNYSYEGTRYPSYAVKARANENAIKIGLTIAGFTYNEFWNVSKASLPKLLKTQYISNNKDMILVLFNGYGERDELYLNDEKIKVYELWEPLLPDTKAGRESSRKPKIFLISASSPNWNVERVTGKINKLCKPPTGRHVKKCVSKLDKGQNNVPITADLLICYEIPAAGMNSKLPAFNESPFIKMFSDELMNEDNTNFFDLIQKILLKFSDNGKNFNEEVPFAFSTLRKLAPVGRLDYERLKFQFKERFLV